MSDRVWKWRYVLSFLPSVAGKRDDPQARLTCDRMVSMLGLTLARQRLRNILDGWQSHRYHSTPFHSWAVQFYTLRDCVYVIAS